MKHFDHITDIIITFATFNRTTLVDLCSRSSNLGHLSLPLFKNDLSCGHRYMDSYGYLSEKSYTKLRNVL